MKLRVSRHLASQMFIRALLVLAGLVTSALAQSDIVGKWTTLPYLMPINPVHVALLYNGKVLIVSGSGNLAGNTNLQTGLWDPQTGAITTQPAPWDMFCNGSRNGSRRVRSGVASNPGSAGAVIKKRPAPCSIVDVANRRRMRHDSRGHQG